MKKGRKILKCICILGALLLFMNIVPFNTKATETTNENTLVISDERILKEEYMNSTVTDVILEEGVKRIGTSSFENCKSLVNITLPSSLLEIGKNAFFNSDSLKNVYYNGTIEDWCKIDFKHTSSHPMYYAEHFYMLDENNQYYEVTELKIPDSVKKIGNYQFCGFENLLKVELSKYLTIIDDYALAYCSKLTTITIPSSVKKINSAAFTGSGIYEIVNNSNVYIGIGDYGIGKNIKVLVNNDGSKTYKTGVTEILEHDDFIFVKENDIYKLIAYKGLNENITLPDTINGATYVLESISGVTNLVIPETVANIEKTALIYNETLTTITIPKSLKQIELEMFYNCKNLRDIYYNGTMEDWCKLSILYDYTPYEQSLPSYYADNIYLLNENNEYYKPTEIVIPQGIEKIGNYQFFGFKEVTSISISNTVKEISGNAFCNCTLVKDIYYNGTIEDWCQVKRGYAYFAEGMTNYDNFYMLDENNQYYIPTDIIIPEGIETIWGNSFYYFPFLNSITIPKSVKSIESGAFDWCNNLSNIYYNGTIEDWCKMNMNDSSMMSYVNNIYMLDDKGEYYRITEIAIPEGITTLGNYQFYGFGELTTVILPSTLTEIGYYSFVDCHIDTIINNSDLNITFSYYGNGYIGRDALAIVDKNGNVSYKNNSFEYIEQDDFLYRVIGENYQLIAYIGDENIVTLPLTINGKTYTIFSSTGMINVVIPEGMETISSGSFSNNKLLKSIVIPKSISYIDDEAFENCDELTDVYYNGTLEDWCKLSFSVYSNPYCMRDVEHIYMLNENDEYYEVKHIIVPNVKNSIGYKQFYYFNELEKVIISDGISYIGESAFYGCEKLTDVIIPDSVRKIGDDAFNWCDNLTNVYFNGTIEDWCNIIFEDYTSNPMYYAEHFYMLNENNEYYEVEKIEIPSTITKIGNYQFCGLKNIKEVVIPDSVIELGYGSFSHCSSLQKVKLSENVTKIPDNCFFGCNSLVDFNSFENITNIGDSAFYECSSLTGVLDLPNIIVLGKYAFFGCNSLTELIINEGAQSLGRLSFDGCESLEKITIPFIGENQDSGDNMCHMFGNPYLTYEEFPASIKEIVLTNPTQLSSRPFPLLENVGKITLPETLTTLDEFDFYSEGNGLKEINIPSSVIEINGNPFAGNNIIENIIIDEKENPKYKFENNILMDINYNVVISGFPGAVIPEGTERIGSAAFYDIDIEEIIIPDSVVSIGKDAFVNCEFLTEIRIPENVQYIGEHAFMGCDNLEKMIIDSPAIASSINEYYFGYGSGYELSPFIYINKEIINTSSYMGTEYYEYNTVVIDGVEYVEYSTHLLTFVDEARQTCVKDGHTEYRYCEECDYKTEYEVLPAFGSHSYGDWKVIIEPTHDTPGMEIKSCKQCIDIKFNELPALGHIYESELVEPTCTKDGYTLHKCECGDSYKTDEVVSLGHTEVIDDKVEPTCTETGLTEGCHCSVCNHVIVAQDTIPVLGHSYGEWVVVKEATEKETGLKEKVCSVCNDKVTEEIALLVHTHKYGNEYKYDKEIHYHECSCGDRIDESEHTFDTTIIKEATEKETGKVKYSCNECDYEYEVETPVLEATGCKTFHWIILLLLLLLIIGIYLYYRYRLSKKERQQEKSNQNC